MNSVLFFTIRSYPPATVCRLRKRLHRGHLFVASRRQQSQLRWSLLLHQLTLQFLRLGHHFLPTQLPSSDAAQHDPLTGIRAGGIWSETSALTHAKCVSPAYGHHWPTVDVRPGPILLRFRRDPEHKRRGPSPSSQGSTRYHIQLQKQFNIDLSLRVAPASLHASCHP